MKDRLWYLFYLNQVTGPNVPMFEHIMARYKSIEELYEFAKNKDEKALTQVSRELAQKLIKLADEELIGARLRWIKDRGIHLVPYESEEYPDLLKEIKNPPSMLYVKGRPLNEMGLPIAIVGMRKNTDYGETITTHFASALVQNGVTVISGMAYGIDAIAANAALNTHGADFPTAAVLGCGIDVIYPAENARLYDIIARRGAIISEYLPGTRPYRDNFPIRNRIISGLSKGVIVAEAGGRSGTSITAGHALEQGRDVFAIPGRITDENSLGPNRMIQRGEAKPVFCAADVLIEYGIDISNKSGIKNTKDKTSDTKTEKVEPEPEHKEIKRPVIEEEGKAKKKKKSPKPAKTEKPPKEPVDFDALSPIETQIVKELEKSQRNADELCDILSIDAATVNSSLTSLQFSGIIKQLPGRLFGL